MKGRDTRMELLFPLLLFLPLLFLIMRQRKQQRTIVDQQGRLRVGMTVMTTAGLYGTVIDIEDDVMTLEVDDDVQLRWSKLAVARIVDDGTAVADESDDGAESQDQYEYEDTDEHQVGAETVAEHDTPGRRDSSHEPAGATSAAEQVDIRKDSSRRASSPDGV